MTTTRGRGDVLREARRRDSQQKRAKVLATVDSMAASGQEITMLGVARAAGVSNWLVYQPEIKAHIDKARKGQESTATRERSGGRSASSASLAVDLELARTEIRSLREERDKLKDVLRRNLGQQLQQADSGDLKARMDELLTANHQLEERLSAALKELKKTQSKLEESELDLAGARAGIAQMMRDRAVRPT
ncbi:DUF6262 family protein [Kitasatospora sp. NPDC002551]|uniref:DUF6262 family protein n=1 Tax=Kitasatospora sp. NPDC002551 TaxID=3154539 RepID=UPI00331B06D7